MKYIIFIFAAIVHLPCFLRAQSLVDQFDTIAQNNDMLGGAVVVFCEDGIIENIAIGTSDVTRDIDATVDTKYRIASISKTITAIAVMQLVEQNLLDLDQDISTILGYSVQNPNHPTIPITSRMLLSHTSTIVDGTTYSDFMGATVSDSPIPNLSEILTVGGDYYTASQFNNTQPGTYFNYSNINFVILGTIIEKITNLRFDVYCKQNISMPLGIDASFNVNDLTNIDQLAVIYRKEGTVWTPQVDNYQGTQPFFSNLNGYIPGTNGGRFGPQGGFRCSAQDLAKIFLVLMNNGSFDGDTLLSEASCNAMVNNEWTYNGNNGNNYFGLFRSWGLGIHRVTSTPGGDVALPGSSTMFGHPGEAYGLVSDAYFDTTRKVGFVFINNGVGIGYQTGNNSGFYTIEEEVFEAIENHSNLAGCSQTSVQQQSDDTIVQIYQNPSTGKVHIELPNQSPLSVSVFDIKGALIKETVDVQIDVSAFAKGVYFIKAKTKEGMYHYKFVNQ
jgi:CubicO group peptidase (beta-lactamase class C family)